MDIIPDALHESFQLNLKSRVQARKVHETADFTAPQLIEKLTEFRVPSMTEA